MPGHSFLSNCRRKAAEEIEVELQEAELFDDGADDQEANSLRKQAAAWLSAALPVWGTPAKEAAEPAKKRDDKLWHSLTPHADDLQEALLEFDGAYDRLWNIMTDINTDLMLLQGLHSSESETSGLTRSLRAVDESHVQYPVLSQAAGALIRIREADQESFRSLGMFHQDLERLLSCEVWCSQEAVVALEKTRERMDMANTRLKVARNSKDKKQISATRDKVDLCKDMYEAQAAVVEELLPEVVVKIDGAIASGLATYLRAQHRRFRSGCSALEALDFSLPTLDAAADKGFAGSVQRRLSSRRRKIAEQEGRGGSLHRILTSPADNFAVATAVAEATTHEGNTEVIGALARLLDDVDTCVPMLRALLRSEVLLTNSLAEGTAALAAFVSGRVCRRLLVASVKVSCQDKKGSRYGPHAFEQAMVMMCTSPDFVSDLESSQPSNTTQVQFRNNCLGFCRTIIDAPIESCPGVLRTICCYVREQLTMRGASSQVQHTTLYGIFALCYLCPALRDPAAFGICGFPHPFSTQDRELMALVAAGLERDVGLGDNRSSKRQLSPDLRQVLQEMRKLIGEYCLQVLGESRDFGAPSSGASASSMQPMSGQSLMSGGSLEEPTLSPEVFKDLENVANFSTARMDTLKTILERSGHQALALAFEEELNRNELALRNEEMAALEQATKKKSVVKSGRVCTLPGLARIKGGKGRLFGLKYRELRSDEEGSDEPSDEDVQLSSHFPSMASRVVPAAAGGEVSKIWDELTGVGVQFEHDKQGYLKVKSIAAGGPAERCGMMDVGDVLVDVSGHNFYVHDDPLEAVRELIYGKVGTVIEFGLQKPGSGQVKRVKLRRAERYGYDSKNDADFAPVQALQAATPESSLQVRPRVKVRTTFTKGQSEHSRPRGEAAQGVHSRPHGYMSAPGGPRWEADAITSTGSVGSEKFELSGVGVALKIGADDMFYVHDILAGGPAERNGCLGHGDRMIAINDVNLEGKRFSECAKILNGSMGTLANLDLVSLGDFGSSEPQVKRVTLRRTWVPDMVWNAAGDEVAPRQEESGDIGGDQSAKQAFVPHGVGITFTKTQNDSTFSVKRVTEGGPADLAGTIKSGDIIKTVDGVSVERKSYRQFARMILGPLGSIVQLGIERGADREPHLIQLERGPASTNLVSENSSDSMSSGDGADEPPSRRTTMPEANVPSSHSRAQHSAASPPAAAPAEMVGVGLKCDKMDDGRFVVTGVQPGGAAARSGKIVVGDQVRAVGGVDLAGRSKTDLRDMIMGPMGSSVYLQIIHADGRFDEVNVTRGNGATTPSEASVPESSTSSGVMAHNSGVGDLSMQITRIGSGLFKVCEILAGGGASQNGSIRIGDVITEVDGVRVMHLNDQTVAEMLCGVAGTNVNLGLRTSDGVDRTVDVIRTPSILAKIGGGQQLEEEKSFDGGSEYGDDDTDSVRSSRSKKTGLGMSFKSNHTGMIIVRRVKEGGPAERLGIREGDTIVALDDCQLQNMYSHKKELSRLMLGYAGSQAKVALQRKGQTKIEQMLLTRGRDGDDGGESSSRGMAPIAPQESWMSDQSFGSSNKVGLGLTFVKPDGQPGVVVKRVKEGGAAAATGRLFPGDRVMQIDGDDLLQVTSKMLTNLVMGPQGSSANLTVRRTDGSMEEVNVVRVVTEESSGPSYGELRSEPSLDFSVCGESRREKCGLGMTFRPPDGSPGMIINRIKDNGPAVGNGVEKGDRLLAVDGVYLDTRSSSGLSRMLLGTEGTQAQLEIRKADGRTIRVVITRGEGGIGLHSENSRESIGSVTSSVDSEAASDMSGDQDLRVGIGLTFHRPDGRGGVLVKRVKENGAAALDGRIAPGDRLFAIDGNHLGDKISHEDLTRMVLGEAGSSVRLHVQYKSGASEEVKLGRVHNCLPSDNADRNAASSSAQLCGLGVTFFPPNEGNSQVVIKRVKEGGAASVSGRIIASDRLVEIEGKQVHLLSGSELKMLLMGPPGSSCEVRVQHQNGVFENVKLVRTAKGWDEPARSASRGLGITSDMSFDELPFAAMSRGERRRKVGLGMVLNEDDGGEGLLIRKVKAGSASKLSGKVHAGDRLLSLDGTSIANLERQEIEKLVMGPAGSTSICVVRRKDGSLDHVMLNRSETMSQDDEESADVEEEEADDEDEQTRPVGLGMVFLRPDGKGGRVIKRLKEGSAADAHSDVHPGDRCLTINGKTVDNMTDREMSDSNRGMIGTTAVVVLRSKSGIIKECTLKRRKPVFDNIVEGCGSEASFDSSIASALSATDTSGRSGLGMTFHEWNSASGGLRVKRVKKGGAADNSGRIHPGDVVQTIDGKSLEQIEHRALLKLLMGPEGSIAVINMIASDNQAMQIILTRAPRGGNMQYDMESPRSSHSKDEGISPTKISPTKPEMQRSSPPVTVEQVSPSSSVASGVSPRVLPMKAVSPPQRMTPPQAGPPAASSPPSQMPKVIATAAASPPSENSSFQQEAPSPPAQVPKILVPVASVSPPGKQAPLPPPAKKPEVQQQLEQEKAADMPPASDFKPLLIGMGAAFAQESFPDNGDDDDDQVFGEEQNSDNLRDDLSEVSMDDSVLGGDDDKDDVRRQCGLGITFRKQDGKGGVVVKRVKPGGGADLSGEILSGDRVIRLDGMLLDKVSQAELASMTIGDEGTEALLEVIRASTGQEVMVSVSRRRSSRGLSFADKEVREYSLVSGQLSRESSREDLGEEGDLEFKDGRKIPRIARTGLGFTFKASDGKGGVMVKRVKEDGPALGIVQEGDRIMSIDDWPLNDISNQNLVRLTLGIPGTEAVLKIVRPGVGGISDVTILRPDPAASPSAVPATTPQSVPPISLSQGSSDSIGSQVSTSSSVAGQVVAGIAGAGKQYGLGLTFKPKADGVGVTVKRVKEDGAAATEGSITAGDVVVSIDDTAMAGLDQIGQAKLIMGYEGSVAKLVVLKNGTGQQITVMLPRSKPNATCLPENSSDSIGSISSEVSTSSSTVSPEQLSNEASNVGGKPVGIGLTFLKADQASGGLPVKRVKEDGPAAASTIKPGDIVLSIDGVTLGSLDTKGLTKAMMSHPGSSARLDILKKNGQRETVVLYRGGGVSSLSENSTESINSLSSDLSISSSTSPGVQDGQDKSVGIGLTFLKPDKASGGLPVMRIKEDGCAVNSTICPGDIVLSIDGVGPLGTLDSKAQTKAMMGASGSTARVELLKKATGQKDTVLLTRGGVASSLTEHSQESISSEMSISSSTSPSFREDVLSDGNKSAGLGLTFLKPDKASGGLPVKRIKEDGPAIKSTICPGDIVLSIDGVGPLGSLDSKAQTKAMMGASGSTARVELLKKATGQKDTVFLTRCVPPLRQGSSESIGSVASVAASDVSTSSISSSSSSSAKVALGFTYKASKSDGRWRASTIKGGWAEQSGMVKSGDVIVSVGGTQCTGLDFKAVTSLLQGPENSTVSLVLERDGATFSAEGRRIKSSPCTNGE